MPRPLRLNINSSTIARLESKLKDGPQSGLSLVEVNGANVVQFATDKVGTMEAGVLLAEICLGGEASVSIVDPGPAEISRPQVSVKTSNPLVDCIGCQYAGWQLSVSGFSAMASGPIRLLRGSEQILERYGLTQTDRRAVIVLEADKLPTEAVVNHIVQQCGVDAADLFICLANTSSLPGSIQVVARSVETAMHKLHEVGFDLASVQSGQGSAPLPPSTDSDLTAMGWTNDAMLFGGSVQLTVDADDQDIVSLIDQVPSSSSDRFGKPFLTVFEEAGRDFYKIDPLLFAPAKIVIENARTGNRFSAGELHRDVLETSFGI